MQTNKQLTNERTTRKTRSVAVAKNSDRTEYSIATETNSENAGIAWNRPILVVA